MKIIIVGAAGDVGKAACAELGQRHDLITVGRSSGDLQVDISDRISIDNMYKKIGPVDAVVSTAGDVHFATLEEQTEETMMLGFRQKVMGQINLVLAGIKSVKDGGSFTLTSGVLDRDPIRMGVAVFRTGSRLI
ncbi:short chain dehydrogenase [Roseibium algae]|uniref:Short chain dehydrogenase n=1 Tax=Roseibium algae TaxID=3123038 RepID=A0ABU8TNH9_9HYPH